VRTTVTGIGQQVVDLLRVLDVRLLVKAAANIVPPALLSDAYASLHWLLQAPWSTGSCMTRVLRRFKPLRDLLRNLPSPAVPPLATLRRRPLLAIFCPTLLRGVLKTRQVLLAVA
jgi:hypothetical protein